MQQLLFLLALCVLFAHGGKHKFDRYKLVQNSEVIFREGLFSPADAPATSPPGDGQSFVKVEMNVIHSKPGEALLNLLYYGQAEAKKLGYKDEENKKTYLCCNEKLFESANCYGAQLGEVIVNPNHGKLIYSPIGIRFNETVDFSHQFSTIVSDMYFLAMVNCNGSHSGELLLTGQVTFLNPYGYLPGQLYFFMPYYLSVALLYVLVTTAWSALMIKHRKVLLPLQHGITGVFLLGAFETWVWYFEHLGYNNEGDNYVGAMVVGVLLSTARRTVARVLVLVVSMGYGVMKPTLGTTKYSIGVMAILYAFFSGTAKVVELVQRSQTVSFYVVFFLIFPIAILDTGFYWWIFLSLLRSIHTLQTRNQPLKLQMYKRFMMVLVFSGIVSGLVIMTQLFVTVSQDYEDRWKTEWAWDAFWYLLYVILLCAIAFIWRPVANNTRYAYAPLQENNDENVVTLNDGESHELNAFSSAVRERNRTNYAESDEEAMSFSKKKGPSSVAFSIDGEEDDVASTKMD